jgi:hypothetical protein
MRRETPGPMSRDRSQRAAIKELAVRRVEAVWNCLGVLSPEMTLPDRKALATKMLDLCRGETDSSPRITISPAQVQEIVWRTSQCANRYCSMVLFSREMADELNEFFRQE